MAERRMFAKTIIDSDAFLDMPMSAQALYFHLSMRADDEGFVNNPKKIQRMIGASEDDARLLIAKRFIIVFESGVIVIKHWKIHNYVRSDRFKETLYQEEKAMLMLDEKNAYTERNKNCGIPSDIPMVSKRGTQDSIGKDSIGKVKEIIADEKGAEVKVESDKSQVNVVATLVIPYLNKKARTNYRTKTDSTRRYIQARLNEGFTLDDFYKVIDKKVEEWQGTPMEKYLRPETLFGTKFESYLNARINSKKEKGKLKREPNFDINELYQKAINNNDYDI